MLAFPLLLLLSALCESKASTCPQEENLPWSYNGKTNNPYLWGKTYPDCYGKNQSPIALNSMTAEKCTTVPPLKMQNFDVPVTKGTVMNSGYTVYIFPKDGVDRFVDVDNKHYSLKQFHCHWGSSLHSLDGRKFDAECHFVLYTEKGDTSYIGIIFQESPHNNTGFDPLMQRLPNVLFKSDTTELTTPMDFGKILPANPGPLYKYSGSMIIPPCHEGIVWLMLKGVQPIGTHQLEQLKRLYLVPEEEQSPGCHIHDNYRRPIYPLNGRVVYTNA